MDFRAYEQEHRELWLDVFRDELTALYTAGFVHCDLRRPSNIVSAPFDNIFLTAEGLRLIDVGISALRIKVLAMTSLHAFWSMNEQKWKHLRRTFWNGKLLLSFCRCFPLTQQLHTSTTRKCR